MSLSGVVGGLPRTRRLAPLCGPLMGSASMVMRKGTCLLPAMSFSCSNRSLITAVFEKLNLPNTPDLGKETSLVANGGHVNFVQPSTFPHFFNSAKLHRLDTAAWKWLPPVTIPGFSVGSRFRSCAWGDKEIVCTSLKNPLTIVNLEKADIKRSKRRIPFKNYTAVVAGSPQKVWIAGEFSYEERTQNVPVRVACWEREEDGMHLNSKLVPTLFFFFLLSSLSLSPLSLLPLSLSTPLCFSLLNVLSPVYTLQGEGDISLEVKGKNRPTDRKTLQLLPWDNGFLALSSDNNANYLRVFHFNTELLEWKKLSRKTEEEGLHPAKRNDGAVVRVGSNKVLVFGGREGKRRPNNEIWCFDTVQRTWEKVEAKGEELPPIAGHSAVLVEHNKVLLAGGGVRAGLFGGVAANNTSWLVTLEGL
ncbi:hypothetical protein QOT17_016650 [Balamuthia mandrillaris]